MSELEVLKRITKLKLLGCSCANCTGNIELKKYNNCVVSKLTNSESDICEYYFPRHYVIEANDK